MYCQIWLKRFQVIHKCYILLICKEPRSVFQNHTSQLKVKITQDTIKRDICWYGKNWVINRSVTLTFTATSYLNRKSYFYSYKAGRNKYGSYSNSLNYFFYFKLFVRKIKNQIGAMIYFHRLSIQFYTSWVKTQKLENN